MGAETEDDGGAGEGGEGEGDGVEVRQLDEEGVMKDVAGRAAPDGNRRVSCRRPRALCLMSRAPRHDRYMRVVRLHCSVRSEWSSRA